MKIAASYIFLLNRLFVVDEFIKLKLAYIIEIYHDHQIIDSHHIVLSAKVEVLRMYIPSKRLPKNECPTTK